jgi:hypothetical protein
MFHKRSTYFHIRYVPQTLHIFSYPLCSTNAPYIFIFALFHKRPTKYSIHDNYDILQTCSISWLQHTMHYYFNLFMKIKVWKYLRHKSKKERQNTVQKTNVWEKTNDAKIRVNWDVVPSSWVTIVVLFLLKSRWQVMKEVRRIQTKTDKTYP